MLADLWRNNRTVMLIATAVLAATVGLVAFMLAVSARGNAARTAASSARPTSGTPQASVAPLSESVAPPTTIGSPVPVPGVTSVVKLNTSQQAEASAARASEARFLSAYPSIKPATSTPLPSLPALATAQPLLFAQAFTMHLLRIDFRRETRSQLLSWAQYESAPMFDDGTGLSPSNRAKLLALSLTDPTTTNTGAPVVPTGSGWQSLAAQSAQQTVTSVTATPDPQWEAALAAGYQSPDRLTTWVDVSATVTTRVLLGHTPTTHRTTVAFRLLLGTSLRGRYGAVAVYAYQSKPPGAGR